MKKNVAYENGVIYSKGKNSSCLVTNGYDKTQESFIYQIVMTEFKHTIKF